MSKPASVAAVRALADEYHDVMIDHDGNVGSVLDKLDELGIADNTIVIYTTDNGPHMNTWPDAAMTPFRSEKNTNWEGAFRVPCLVRWPGKIKPGSVSNEIVSIMDWLPTFLAAAGEPDIMEKLLNGAQVPASDLQGPSRRLQPPALLTGQERSGPRQGSSTSPMTAICWHCATTTGRWSSWSSAREARLQIWAEPFTPLARAENLQSADRSL